MNRGELEARRLAAVRDIKMGIPGGVMVERYKISRTTLTRWRRAVKDGRSLKATVCKGRPRRLDAGKESILKRLWFLGPQLLIGTDTDHWTNGRFAKAVGQHMGIRYSRDHMGRIMHRLGLGIPKRENRRAGWALGAIE